MAQTKKTALVTGGTGFVGSQIVREASAAGYAVRVLHRASSKLDALAGLNYTSAIGDITDADSLAAACAGIDVVFHAAAVADYWRADVTRMYEANIAGTRRVLAAARSAGVRRVVFTSSAAALGMRKNSADPVDETYRFNMGAHKFPYGYSKAMAEIVALEAVQAGQDVVIVNPAVVIGPGDLNVISGAFILQIHELGWRVPVPPGGVAVTDVRDVARWHLAAAEHGRTGERYVLSTANYPYAEWFALIADVVGAARPGLPVPGWALSPIGYAIDFLKARGIALPVDGVQTRLGSRFIYFDARKAWDELGPPTVDMRTSVADTFAWYQAHGYVTD